MKKNLVSVSIISLILFAAEPRVCLGQASVMTDGEMDAVSAQGFELNTEGAIEYRLSVLGNAVAQELAGSLQGPSATAQISAVGGIAVSQTNMTHLASLDGNIDGAVIDSINTASVTSDTPSDVSQSNLVFLAAPNGTISNSVINCVNSADFSSIAAVGSVNQSSVSVFVARNFTDNTITHSNSVTAGGESLVSTSSTQSLTLQSNGLTARVYIDQISIN